VKEVSSYNLSAPCSVILIQPLWLAAKVDSGNTGMIVATYVVKPGDTLSEVLPTSLFIGGHYSIDV
jgi:hypothetical protein